MTPRTQEWHGQWLSLHDLAALFDKSYDTVWRMVRHGDGCAGITVHRIRGRIWVRVSADVYDSLSHPAA